MEELTPHSLPQIRAGKLKRAVTEANSGISSLINQVKNGLVFWYGDLGLQWFIEKGKLDLQEVNDVLEKDDLRLCLEPEEIQQRVTNIEAAMLEFKKAIIENTFDLANEDEAKLKVAKGSAKTEGALKQLNGDDPDGVPTVDLKRLIPAEHMHAWSNRTKLAKTDYKLQISETEVWNLRTQQVEARSAL